MAAPNLRPRMPEGNTAPPGPFGGRHSRTMSCSRRNFLRCGRFCPFGERHVQQSEQPQSDWHPKCLSLQPRPDTHRQPTHRVLKTQHHSRTTKTGRRFCHAALMRSTDRMRAVLCAQGPLVATLRCPEATVQSPHPATRAIVEAAKLSSHSGNPKTRRERHCVCTVACLRGHLRSKSTELSRRRRR